MTKIAKITKALSKMKMKTENVLVIYYLVILAILALNLLKQH